MPAFYPPVKPCPCGSGRSYTACCQPFHAGERLPDTPEQLMRSRYSAYFLQHTAYVLETCHPDKRPENLDLNDGIRYTGLTVHEASGDEVEFSVTLKTPDGQGHRFRERSRFEQLEGRWVYVEGTVKAY